MSRMVEMKLREETLELDEEKRMVMMSLYSSEMEIFGALA